MNLQLWPIKINTKLFVLFRILNQIHYLYLREQTATSHITYKNNFNSLKRVKYGCYGTAMLLCMRHLCMIDVYLKRKDVLNKSTCTTVAKKPFI